MYQKTAINMRLAKIQAKIYDLETLAFETTEEVNRLVNEICELVAVRYREAKTQEKKSHNLCSEEKSPDYFYEYKNIGEVPVGKYHTIFDPVGTTLKEETSKKILKKIKGKKK